MFWIEIEERHICIDYLQMFEWHDGRLYVHILGRSVPEIFDDPKGVLHSNLIKYLEKKVAK